MSKKDLYVSVDNLKRKMRIKSFEYPLNIFDICQNRLINIEIGLANFRTHDLRGMAIISEDTRRENHVILVNANRSQVEINYHGSHELMHIIMQKNVAGQTFKCYDNVKPLQNSYIEWQANEGAAEFLVPYKMLLPLVKDNFDDICSCIGSYGFCEKYAPLFGVSTIVMQNRLNSLSYEINQYMKGVPLHNVRILSRYQQLKFGIHVQPFTNCNDIRHANALNDFRAEIRI
jgi:Zn-dependent peptidase ImmA (M78 family)